MLAEAVAGGDDDIAIAADISETAADVRAELDEADRLEAAAREAKQRAADRILLAREAREQLIADRKAAGEPAPAGFPDVGGRTLRGMLEVLADAPPRNHAVRIAQLDREAEDLRISLERKHREELEREARIQQWEKRKAAEEEALQRENSERHREWVEKAKAKREERAALADAYRRRASV